MTPYSAIYARFLSKIQDYSLLKELELDQVYAESLMQSYLDSAIPHFIYISKDRLKRDDTTKTFNVELSEMEQEILAIYMVKEYLRPKIIRDETLEQRLGSKDYNTYSPAKLMEQIREIVKDLDSEASVMMTQYCYMRDL